MNAALKLTLVALLLAVAGCASPAAETSAGTTPTKIVLAIQPTDNADTIQDRATELEAFLESSMASRGINADVQIIVPLTYVGVVEALRFGHAQAAMMSAWPSVIANQKAGAEIVLAEQRDVFDAQKQPVVAPYYYSYYIVMPDSPYHTLAETAGATVAYSSATSTSGYVFPVAKLVEDGLVTVAAGKEVDATKHFGAVTFAGGYRQAWEALKNGQADVAVIAGDVNAQLYNEVLSNSRVIATQGPIPSHGVVFAKDFTGPEADALKAAFLDLKGEEKDLMRKLVSGIFVEFQETTTREHTKALSEALRITNLPFADKLKA